MMHACPDGTHTRLVRTGPTGTTVGVWFDCPRCGYRKSGQAMYDDAARALHDPRIRAALAR